MSSVWILTHEDPTAMASGRMLPELNKVVTTELNSVVKRTSIAHRSCHPKAREVLSFFLCQHFC